MRFHHLMAVGLALVVGSAATRSPLPSAIAETDADPARDSDLDVSGMYADAQLPTETVHRVTFVSPYRD